MINFQLKIFKFTIQKLILLIKNEIDQVYKKLMLYNIQTYYMIEILNYILTSNT